MAHDRSNPGTRKIVETIPTGAMKPPPEREQIPYVAKKEEPEIRAREETTIRPRFRVSCKELLSMRGVTDKMMFPQKIDRFLGSQRDVWCEFHRAFGHSVERCITLSHQLASLVKEGFLKEYLEANQEKLRREAATEDQTHARGGSSASKQKRYARAIMSLDTRRSDRPTEPSLYFTGSDHEDVFPHEDDLVVIFVVTVG